ncbi:MAG: hypothetical protein ABIG11_11085 [bacterium]
MKKILMLVGSSILGMGIANSGPVLDDLTGMSGELRPATLLLTDNSGQITAAPVVEAPAADLDSLRAEFAGLMRKYQEAVNQTSDASDEVQDAIRGVRIAESHSSDLLFGLADVVEARGKLMGVLTRAQGKLGNACSIGGDVQTALIRYYNTANMPVPAGVAQCVKQERVRIESLKEKIQDMQIAWDVLKKARCVEDRVERMVDYIGVQQSVFTAQTELLEEITRCMGILINGMN